MQKHQDLRSISAHSDSFDVMCFKYILPIYHLVCVYGGKFLSFLLYSQKFSFIQYFLRG